MKRLQEYSKRLEHDLLIIQELMKKYNIPSLSPPQNKDTKNDLSKIQRT